MMTPEWAFLWLADHVKFGIPIDPEARKLLNPAFDVCISEGVSLEKALGLRRRGGVSRRREEALATRNAMLRHLAREHPEWSGLEPSVVARKMRRAFEQYETRRWPRDRRLSESPSVEPAATFFRLLKNDWQMPQGPRLRQILGREIQSAV